MLKFILGVSILISFLLAGCGGNSSTVQPPDDYSFNSPEPQPQSNDEPNKHEEVETPSTVTKIFEQVLQDMRTANEADPAVVPFNDAPDWQADEIGFLNYVAADINAFWPTILAGTSKPYFNPGLKYPSSEGNVTHGCAGEQHTSDGWFYCSEDSTVYYVPYPMLSDQIKPTGKFGIALIIAHEYGHHLQNVLGITKAVNKERAKYENGSVEYYRWSRLQELQADCFAGIWAHYKMAQNQLNNQDIISGVLSLAFIGDDVLGTSEVEKQTHGGLEDRLSWFDVGFQTGDMSQCATFQRDGNPPGVYDNLITEFFVNATNESCQVIDDNNDDTTKTIRCSFTHGTQTVVVDYDAWSSGGDIFRYLDVPVDKELYRDTWKGSGESTQSGNIVSFNSSEGLVVYWDVLGIPLTGTIYWYDNDVDAVIEWFYKVGSLHNP